MQLYKCLSEQLVSLSPLPKRKPSLQELEALDESLTLPHKKLKALSKDPEGPKTQLETLMSFTESEEEKKALLMDFALSWAPVWRFSKLLRGKLPPVIRHAS